MILQALYEYYQRKGGLAPAGMEWKKIPYIIVIDKEGTFIRIEDTQENKIAKEFLVVKTNGRSGTKMLPNVFWDNIEYTLGYGKNNTEIKKKEKQLQEDNLSEKRVADLLSEKKELEKETLKSIEKNKTFIAMVSHYADKFPHNTEFKALNLFYENHVSEVINHELWAVIEKKPTVNLSFRVEGYNNIIAMHCDLVVENNSEDTLTKKDYPVCLITGKKSPIVATTTPSNVGGQATAKLVAFQVNSGYDSYYKKQGSNASISVEAEAAYTTALNSLLSRESRNKVILGNRIFLFWSVPQDLSQNGSTFESIFASIFNLPSEDTPDRNVGSVKDMLLSPKTGWLKTEGDDKFYILGLAPNAARISVQLWKKGTIKEFASNIGQHFKDLEIIGDRLNDNDSFNTLMSLILSVTFPPKRDKIQPNLPEAIMNSILTNIPYPVSFHQACIRRIKAEQSIYTKRAAILKACLNRKLRFYNYNNEKEITMALDNENLNQGYLCGRLFAVLEYVQEKGMGKSSLRERYLNAASTAPVTVFSRILNLSVYHISKIKSKGLAINMEKLKGEIIGKINSEGIPSRLNLDDQSRFMIGYYHQNKDLYTRKENDNETEIINA